MNEEKKAEKIQEMTDWAWIGICSGSSRNVPIEPGLDQLGSLAKLPPTKVGGNFMFVLVT